MPRSALFQYLTKFILNGCDAGLALASAEAGFVSEQLSRERRILHADLGAR